MHANVPEKNTKTRHKQTDERTYRQWRSEWLLQNAVT